MNNPPCCFKKNLFTASVQINHGVCGTSNKEIFRCIVKDLFEKTVSNIYVFNREVVFHSRNAGNFETGYIRLKIQSQHGQAGAVEVSLEKASVVLELSVRSQ